ncbi:MAG: LysM peptidoglycan-binding domain-containing protein [Acidimicrobiia bacterium]|nr:LysM peptidoglycan-binding domain-containing protein [Acidimicrobiia bacterium]MYG57724.1 LysM peptidoglycan-binding domain-containing protein [Acidimicrobiia bacterium]MYJ32113.1 LysM peptidoglycan-binding domain-containing protein [Acidimicrobiia bacterium]
MNLNENPRGEAVRGLASAALLVGLLIGVPILLIFGVGWPLPQGIPSGSDIVTTIKTGAVPPSTIWKSISVVVWVLWFLLLAGVGVEAWAHLRGRVAPRVAFLPSFIQRFSAQVMGTTLLIAFSLQHPGLATADNQELLAPTTFKIDAEAADAGPHTHTVERNDNLRQLAERYLGDPNRWTEVFVLNEGQTQIDGGSLSDPNQLQAGWKLVMPADSRTPSAAEFKIAENSDGNQQSDVPAIELDHSLITVQTGDTLWGLAAQHLDDPERWVDIFNSNQDIIQDPEVILPGWQLEIPAIDSKPTEILPPAQPLPETVDYTALQIQPLAESVGHTAPVSAYATTRPTVVAVVSSESSDHQSVPTRETMFAVGGLGVFASSLGWVLARLRRTQRRRLPNGRMPVPPSDGAVQLDQQLQAASDPDAALFLDASLRIMSSRVADNPPPSIVGVTMDSSRVSIHLSSPEVAPPGFHIGDDGTTWTLPKDHGLELLLDEADGVPAPLPTLATVGKKDGGEFLLNLEHMATLNLEGNHQAIIELCAAMAMQLASSHLADDLTVLCVGFGRELTVLERVEHVPDLASATERIRCHQRQNQALLGSHPPSDRSRIGGNGDFCHPMVALAPHKLSREDASELLEACDSSVSVVAHGLDGASWAGQLNAHGLLLQPIGLQLEAHGLPDAATAAFAELASSAKDTEGVALTVPTEPQLIEVKHDASAVGLLAVDIEVRVLGTIEVLGAAQPFTSRRALDLVTYLAFHPEGADRDQLRTHIWPSDEPPSESTLANTVSRARKALGTNENGDLYLPRVSAKGIYQLQAGVGTDVGRFEALISAARKDVGERGREQLQSALDLVRGTPFTGSAGDMFRWADFGLRTQIDCLVDTAAHELAARCLEVGDTDSAKKAALTSLRLVGICEQCYRLRLLAAAENPTEVRQIMAELVHLLKRESNQPESDDLIGPELLELYEQLMSTGSLFR